MYTHTQKILELLKEIKCFLWKQKIQIPNSHCIVHELWLIGNSQRIIKCSWTAVMLDSTETSCGSECLAAVQKLIQRTPRTSDSKCPMATPVLHQPHPLKLGQFFIGICCVTALYITHSPHDAFPSSLPSSSFHWIYWILLTVYILRSCNLYIPSIQFSFPLELPPGE